MWTSFFRNMKVLFTELHLLRTEAPLCQRTVGFNDENTPHLASHGPR